MKDVQTIKKKTGTYGFLVSNGWPPITDYLVKWGAHVE